MAQDIKQELTALLNQGLELEHAARIQYLTHAAAVKGPGAEPLIARLTELAGDEQKHEGMFRTLIADYLGGEPSMGLAKTARARDASAILTTNLANEKAAIDLYKQIYRTAADHKDQLAYEYEALEHQLRHIILDEQEHVTELALLLGK